MTNKPMLSVERELIQRIADHCKFWIDHPYLEAIADVEDELRALLDQPACTTPSGKTCPGDGVGACAKCPAAQHQGEPEPCSHEWNDDGEYLLVCTACGAQEDHSPGWRDMSTAPRDGTMLRLLVEFEEHPTEDEDQAPTIGANNFDNDDVDEWKFSGWCWTHDHFVEGKGIPVGWLPMLDGPKVTQGAEQPAPVAVVQSCKIGIYGRAYDLPGTKRAYTYKDQPDNVGAMKLGRAASAAKAGGDSIDHGLSLLKSLSDEGFGVFEVARLNGVKP